MFSVSYKGFGNLGSQTQWWTKLSKYDPGETGTTHSPSKEEGHHYSPLSSSVCYPFSFSVTVSFRPHTSELDSLETWLTYNSLTFYTYVVHKSRVPLKGVDIPVLHTGTPKGITVSCISVKVLEESNKTKYDSPLRKL